MIPFVIPEAVVVDAIVVADAPPVVAGTLPEEVAAAAAATGGRTAKVKNAVCPFISGMGRATLSGTVGSTAGM